MKSETTAKELCATVARLRATDGCSWDRAQTHQSITANLVEECAELLDTIDRQDMAHMKEELGDVLLQVVFHAQMAAEAGHFDFDDVVRGITEKLIRRHPHVFADAEVAQNAEQALQRWEAIKAAEKGQATAKCPLHSIAEDLPPQLSALLYAKKVNTQATRKKLPVARLHKALSAEIASNKRLRLGAVLFDTIIRCCYEGIDPEAALRAYSKELVTRLDRSTNSV